MQPSIQPEVYSIHQEMITALSKQKDELIEKIMYMCLGRKGTIEDALRFSIIYQNSFPNKETIQFDGQTVGEIVTSFSTYDDANNSYKVTWEFKPLPLL